MTRALAFAATLALAGSMAPAGAAGTGQAYDQITRFVQEGTVAATEPGDFQQDWQVAAAPTEDAPKARGMFAKFAEMGREAQSFMDIVKNGMAESHYIAGAKERVDTPSRHRATITDCHARTITYLDLKAKTYHVVSMDQPQTGGGASHDDGKPSPRETDDGTRMKITVLNHALGPKEVFGNHSQGYSSDVTMVTTRNNGDSSTSKEAIKEYASGTSRLWLDCSAGRTELSGGAQSFTAAIAHMNDVMRSLGGYKDPRFTVTSSGPALPTTLAYFEAMSFANEGGNEGHRGGGGTFIIKVERNNVRSITENDSIFSVPDDFTKEK